jgi:GH25 family lysozyme M1 (1,4-beta-N-acetylmuramidase)
MTIRILDVSSNNAHPINWPAIKAAGVTGVYVKCTEGLGYVNPFYAGDVASARAAGLLVGAYHFAHPGNDGAAEARFLLSHMGAYSAGDLPPALDLEVTDGQSAVAVLDYAIAFHQEIAAAKDPDTVYSGQSFMSTYLRDGRLPSQRWVASYGPTSAPGLPVGVDALWQYTDRAQVAGGSFDASVWTGDPASFDAWRHALPAPPHPASRNPYPRPDYAAHGINLKHDSQARGAPVQWAQWALGGNPTGVPSEDTEIRCRNQQAGWGLPQTIAVDKATGDAIVAHGRG